MWLCEAISPPVMWSLVWPAFPATSKRGFKTSPGCVGGWGKNGTSGYRPGGEAAGSRAWVVPPPLPFSRGRAGSGPPGLGGPSDLLGLFVWRGCWKPDFVCPPLLPFSRGVGDLALRVRWSLQAAWAVCSGGAGAGSRISFAPPSSLFLGGWGTWPHGFGGPSKLQGQFFRVARVLIAISGCPPPFF